MLDRPPLNIVLLMYWNLICCVFGTLILGFIFFLTTLHICCIICQPQYVVLTRILQQNINCEKNIVLIWHITKKDKFRVNPPMRRPKVANFVILSQNLGLIIGKKMRKMLKITNSPFKYMQVQSKTISMTQQQRYTARFSIYMEVC